MLVIAGGVIGANRAKFACASHARVTASDVGGADAVGGSGLRGLNDRVAALDGELTVDSPLGSGTRVTAPIPSTSHPT